MFHELSHIYYFEKIGNSLDHLNEKYALSSNLTESTKKFALIMWEEYFASRFLCRYLFGSTDCYIGILIEQYKIIKRDIEKEIDDYRYHSDINKLFILAKEKMTLLNTYMSYSCGMICGLNDDRNSLLNDITKLLKESTGLFEIWEKMYIKYDEIYMKFPTLENIDSKLAELTALFIEMYNHFGIYPKQLDNGQLYIDVPL